ncbi:hypothetical protein FJM65_20650 [Pontibacter mangrovi]|uniref:MPN domain-containing protein n=2 Tax=Pontibacter mangrovi TaxID=2589816 RepID=A0A501VW27_9BACT|nr:hypothetical protein FJM65_20650 [Pontibacter mangrovi]
MMSASAVIISHNHLSGNLKPNQADLQFTKKMIQEGERLDIAVLARLFLTSEGYTHLQTRGFSSPSFQLLSPMCVMRIGDHLGQTGNYDLTK